MLRSLFASNRPVVLAFLVFPAAIAATAALFFSEGAAPVLAGPAFDVLFGYVHSIPALSVILGAAVILTGAALVNSVYNEHEYADRENYMPALVYVLFGISSPEWLYFNPVFTANVFLLLALRRLLRIYRISNAASMLYDAGLFTALAVLFYPPVAVCVPFLWVGMNRLRSATLREWFIPLLGLATPAVYVSAAYWWFELTPDFREFSDLSGSFRFGPDADTAHSGLFYALLGASLVAVLIGSVRFLSRMGVSTVHRKNTKAVFVWFSIFLVFAFVYVCFLPENDVASVASLAAPAAVFAALSFNTDKARRWSGLLLYLWTALVVLRFLYTGIL